MESNVLILTIVANALTLLAVIGSWANLGAKIAKDRLEIERRLTEVTMNLAATDRLDKKREAHTDIDAEKLERRLVRIEQKIDELSRRGLT